MKYTYTAKVVRIIDGDTLVLDIDLGLSVWRHGEHIRLAGIAAPELAQAGGKEARDYLASLCPPGTEVTITTHRDKTEKYGRYLGTLTRPGYRRTLNETMILTGHARRFNTP